jgi:invasion protein IalB
MRFIFCLAATLLIAAAPARAAEFTDMPRWVKYCGNDDKGNDVCITGQVSPAEAGQAPAAVALIEPAGEAKKLFRVSFPPRVQLQPDASLIQIPPGARLVIDKEAPRGAAFFTCTANGCLADYEATPDLIDKLTRGRTLQIQATDVTKQTITLTMPLDDQTGDSLRRARERPPADPKLFGTQQKELRNSIFPDVADAAVAPDAAVVHAPWTKYCTPKVCFTGTDARIEQRPIVAAALIEPAGGPKKLFRVTVPSHNQLQQGANLILDGAPPIHGAFFTCFANGCMADYEATPSLIGRLKSAHTLQVQFVSLDGTPVTFAVPLADQTGNRFRTASEGPPSDPAVYQANQKRQIEELRRRGSGKN